MNGESELLKSHRDSKPSEIVSHTSSSSSSVSDTITIKDSVETLPNKENKRYEGWTPHYTIVKNNKYADSLLLEN
jgi:hypothetical protein